MKDNKEKDLSQGTSDNMVSSVLNDKPFSEDIIPQDKSVVKEQLIIKVLKCYSCEEKKQRKDRK